MSTGLIFLDFDGVLTSERVNIAQNYDYDIWSKFDSVAIDFFNKLHDTYNLNFVWNTTWMHGMKEHDKMTFHWMQTMFRNSGFRGTFADPWRVNPDDKDYSIIYGCNSRNYRAHQVKEYMTNYHLAAYNAKRYMCFDDIDFGYNNILNAKRFIKTDSDNGMLNHHYKRALALASCVFDKE